MTKMLVAVFNFDYIDPTETSKGGAVKQREFVRWLAKQGATFEDGTKHLKVYLNSELSHLPRHPAKE